jgi:hypothetical protein
MKFLEKISPEWILRLGLGLMYLYSGFDLFFNPARWYGFVPQWFSQVMTFLIPIEIYLRIQGAGELLMAFLFLAWFMSIRWVRLAALAATLEMFLIVVLVGIDPITFRDIGILSGAAVLLIMTSLRLSYTQSPAVDN